MRAKTVLICILAATLGVAAENPSALARKARKAERKGDYSNAYLLYSQAVAADPQNQEYWLRSQALKRRAMENIKLDAGIGSILPAPPAEEPPLSPISEEDLSAAREALPPLVLTPTGGPRDFDLSGDNKALFEQLAKAFGLLVVFDTDYPTGRSLRFRMTNATFSEAWHALEAMTGSFTVPANEKLALVAKDTEQKRTELEPSATAVIPFPDALAAQEIQEAARAVQSTFDIRRVGLDNTKKLVLFRDRVSRINPAIELFRRLTGTRGQVMVEIQLLSALDQTALSYGLRLPSSFDLTYIGKATLATVLRGFGNVYTIALAGAEAFANLSYSSTRNIQTTHLLSTSGQAATFHAGDRYPVITQGFFGEIEQGEGQLYRPPPTINFEDLGVVVKVTPFVHGADEVTLDIEAEFKVLAGQQLNGIPVISNRKFTSRVRMRFDQTAVIAGLANKSISQSWSGIPGLAAIPALRANDRTKDEGDLLITIRPMLVNLPPWELPELAQDRGIWVGTEARPLTPLQ